MTIRHRLTIIFLIIFATILFTGAYNISNNIRLINFLQSNAANTMTINQITTASQAENIYTVLFVTILMILMAILYLILYRSIVVPTQKFIEATEEITNGNYEAKININSKDEIGTLAEKFRIMASTINEIRKDIDAKVAERTKSLEKLNQAMTGRELKMVELKKEILDLKNKLNIPGEKQS